VKIVRAGPAFEPANSETHVRDLFSADLALQLGALHIARVVEPVSETLRVFEVRRLEPHAEQRDESDLIFARRHAFPEPVAHREVSYVVAELLDVFTIQPHVPDLVLTDSEQALFELELGVPETQDGPTHELCCLELVMPKLVEQLRALFRQQHALAGLRFRSVEADRQVARSPRRSGWWRARCPVELRRRSRGLALPLETRRANVLVGPNLDRGRVVGRRQHANPLRSSSLNRQWAGTPRTSGGGA
jgi:hypothetical protein